MSRCELTYIATIICPECGHQMQEPIPDSY